MKSSSIKRVVRVALGAALAVGLAAPAAQAYSRLYSYSGSDYTYNNSAATSVQLHDGECDDHQVSANWYPYGQSSWKSKVNGSGCGTTVTVTTTGASGNRHYGHRVVELVPLDFNDYGPWKYPV